MTTNIKLTATQCAVLEHAADQPDGRLSWFPDNVKGGARQKVIDGLFNKALITRDSTTGLSPPRATTPLVLPDQPRRPFTPTPRSRPP